MMNGGPKHRTAFVNARLLDPASGLDAPGALLAEDGRINVDTDAWRSDRLTACAVRPDGRMLFLNA